MFVTSVVLVDSLNHWMLVKLLVTIIQMDVMSLRSVVLIIVKPLTVSKPVISTSVCNVHDVSSIRQLVKRFNVTTSVCLMQLILSFVISMISLFLILLVIASQLNLFVNLLLWTGNVLMNDLLIIRTTANMTLQNQLVSWIFWWCPYVFMN